MNKMPRNRHRVVVSCTIPPELRDEFLRMCKRDNINRSALLESFIRSWVSGQDETPTNKSF
jgi:hypothetical protein